MLHFYPFASPLLSLYQICCEPLYTPLAKTHIPILKAKLWSITSYLNWGCFREICRRTGVIVFIEGLNFPYPKGYFYTLGHALSSHELVRLMFFFSI